MNMDIFDRLKQAAAPQWHSYVDHAFVQQMGDGTLSEAAFRAYLVQDYLFLIQFARAWALAAYKSRRPADIRAAQAGLAAILDETDLHVRLCARWGLSQADIEAAPEHPPPWPTRGMYWTAVLLATCWSCTWRWRPV